MSAFSNLGDLIPRHRDLTKTAIIDLGGEQRPREFSFARIDAMANSVARGLARRGLQRGERVAIVSANRAEYLAAYYGIMRAGFVAVPVNFRFPRETIHFILRDAGAKLVFCDTARAADCPDDLPMVRFGSESSLRAPRSNPGVAHSTPGLLGRSAPRNDEEFDAFLDPGPFDAVAAAPEQPAMILYTSGSTGTPKGVVLSHQSHIWVVEARLAPGLDRHRYLIAAPLYHMNALALAKLACAAYATIVLLPQFSDRAYIEAIGQYRCTWLTAVPPMIAMMLRERELLAHTDLSSVEAVRMGSAPVSASLWAALRTVLPRAAVSNAYGTTEAGPVVFGPHPRGLAQPELSVGYPHPQVALRLVEGDNRDADQGALEMKSPALMLGYHNRPDVKPPITSDGFYITGDVFRRDADGFHYFVGRTDDMFVSGGENIYPADVERMLERHPDVAQAAVVPIADAIKGQKPVAFVILKAGKALDEEDVKRFALEHAPAYQHPRLVFFVDELPLASTNKLDRAALHNMAEEKLAAERC
ncbi:MAG: class I adenylate-forming enzyme family protein [Xanthobacteraceae bacterium]